ncbi:uncharacterized protein B0T15DRAFT_551912 [Chaetomium strumarium]|uniref:Uncharacterized protein n=1 Tax=Chaetomium strumarium TaxID=1170767 RepID=A0AAJ0GUU4_9PEZI|nr:hypothetical protein B0T15DRAFT_551912 [Chaetomium strumarium]
MVTEIPGVPDHVLAQWKRQLSRVPLPIEESVTIYANPVQPLGGLDDGSEIGDGVEGHLVWVGVGDKQVKVVQDFMQSDKQPGTRILTFKEMMEAENVDTPNFLTNAVVVIDNDFGRINHCHLGLFTALQRFWCQRRDRGEGLHAAVVAVSSNEEQLWFDTAINLLWKREICYITLESAPGYTLQMYRRDADTPLYRCIRGSASQEPVVVVCLYPFMQMDKLQPHWKAACERHRLDDPSFRCDALWIWRYNIHELPAVLTEETLRGPRHAVLFVDEALRFLLAIQGLRHYVLPYKWLARQFDTSFLKPTLQDFGCSELYAHLAAGLGQIEQRDDIRVIYGTDRDAPPCEDEDGVARIPHINYQPVWPGSNNRSTNCWGQKPPTRPPFAKFALLHHTTIRFIRRRRRYPRPSLNREVHLTMLTKTKRKRTALAPRLITMPLCHLNRAQHKLRHRPGRWIKRRCGTQRAWLRRNGRAHGRIFD